MKTIILIIIIVSIAVIPPVFAPPPHEKIILNSFGVYSADGKALHQIKTGQPVLMQAEIENIQDDAKQSLAFVVQVFDENKQRISIKWADAILEPRSSLVVSVPWSYTTTGNYTVTFGAIEAIDNPTALSGVYDTAFEIISPSFDPSRIRSSPSLMTPANYSGFFTLDNDSRQIFDTVFEVGQKVKIKSRLDNRLEDSNQGTTRFFIQASHNTIVQTIKVFDFEIKPKSHETFETEYTFGDTGTFYLNIASRSSEPPSPEIGTAYAFSVVDQHSKAYKKNQGCNNENLRPIIKPDFSTVVCTTEETRIVLAQRDWNYP